MAYATIEKSVRDGAPVELFIFEGPSAGLTYRYTNFPVNVNFFETVYTSVPMNRSPVAGASMADTEELMVEMPMSLGVVQEYAFKTPPRRLRLQIVRYHLGDEANYVLYWTGVVTGFAVSNGMAIARSVSIMEDAFRTEIPCVYYQNLCNHRLYDARCGIAQGGSWAQATTVSAIAGKVITVANDGGRDDGWYVGGMIVRGSDSERRMITAHVGNDITVSYAFRTLALSDAVTLHTGCDHTVTMCEDRFANAPNFGGFPYIPKRNPFESGVKGTW